MVRPLQGTGGTIENAGFFTKGREMGSQLAGGIFPGFGEYDPVTGAVQKENLILVKHYKLYLLQEL